jgi:ubiquinol-cytochrome c reductase cytochrome c subunit
VLTRSSTLVKWLFGFAIATTSLGFFATGPAGATWTPTPYATGRYNSGTPNSSSVVKNKSGEVVQYGDSAITYTLPPAALAAVGHQLFEQDCASCHGVDANGRPEPGVGGTYPTLLNVGSAAVDFWVASGRMPASGPASVQPIGKFPRLNNQQALSIAAWIDTLTKTPAQPYVPTINPAGGDVSEGLALFALNCAACHTITGDGDALALDTYSSPLRNVDATQVAEAIRTGPGNMPRFSGNLTDAQVRDIVEYVTEYIEHPRNPGGFGLGGIGPVAEGFVGLALGVGLLCLVAFWVGERS